LTLYNAMQAVLAIVATVVIARRSYDALFEAPLDVAVFLEALGTALEAGELGLARRIAESCAPAWPARLAASTLRALERGADPRAELEESHAAFAHRASRGREVLSGIGRMAGPIALIGVILELGRAAHGGEGLVGLQQGLAARIALQRSLLTFSLGLSTTLLCFAAAAMLRRHALALCEDLGRVVAALERALSASGER
jgi:hypothetical protein